ncbi:MAG: sulfatase [Myxococcota bacterium]
MARGILDSAWPYFTLAGLLLVAALATQFEVRVPSRDTAPISELAKLRDRDDLSVVFILIDTLRADRLGIYGYERPTSRILDDAASHAIVFDNVQSQSTWTKTSMASLWTGTHPIRNGILRYDHVIPDSAVMPAEIFRDAGFRTGGVWRNGWVEPNFGFAQGFDVYVKPVPGAERMRLHRQNPTPSPLLGTDEDLTVSAIDFIDQHRGDRFLLYLHYMDVHQYVYDDTASIFGTSYSDAYDQAIHWTDRLIGRLLDGMEQADVLKRSVIVIASDHGEAFREHGMEGHARDLYTEVTHVPLIIIPPFILEEGVRVPDVVSNVDVWPTILDIVGLPPLPEADGRSLVPLILSAGGEDVDTEGVARPVYSQLRRGWGRPTTNAASLVSVAHDGKRLITEIDSEEHVTEFYDHTVDPGEQTDLLKEDGADASAHRKLVDEYVELEGTSPWGEEPTSVELDEMRLNHLRALGYVIQGEAPLRHEGPQKR